jgi:hypothetical protein
MIHYSYKNININSIYGIRTRLSKGETRFYIGKYYYEVMPNGNLRRREQKAGYLPTSDWEVVGEFICAD